MPTLTGFDHVLVIILYQFLSKHIAMSTHAATTLEDNAPNLPSSRWT